MTAAWISFSAALMVAWLGLSAAATLLGGLRDELADECSDDANRGDESEQSTPKSPIGLNLHHRP